MSRLPEPHETGPGPEVGPGRFRALVPDRLRASVVFELPGGGGTATVQLLVVSRAAWYARPESQDPAWSSVPFGPFLISCRLDF